MKYRISDVASINESSISKSTYIGSVNYVDTSSVISGNLMDIGIIQVYPRHQVGQED